MKIKRRSVLRGKMSNKKVFKGSHVIVCADGIL
jgi:hypothetical protein